MTLFSEKQMTVTSSEDEITITTPKILTLNGGGSYLKLSKNGIEHGSEGMMIMKVATYLVPGTPASLPCDTPDFPLISLNPDTNNEPGTDNSDSSENDGQHRQNQPEKDPAKVRPLSRNGKVLDLQLTMIQRAIVLSVTDI